MPHQDRSADIHANTGRTVLAWYRHTLHRRQRSLHANPAEAVGFRIKDADASRDDVADFHGEGLGSRNNLRRPIRHLLRKVLDRLLLAQMVGLGGRTAQQLIRNDDGGNRLGGMIWRCHATSAWLWSILHRSVPFTSPFCVRFDSRHLPGLQHTGSTAFLTATLGMKLEAVRFSLCHASMRSM